MLLEETAISFFLLLLLLQIFAAFRYQMANLASCCLWNVEYMLKFITCEIGISQVILGVDIVDRAICCSSFSIVVTNMISFVRTQLA